MSSSNTYHLLNANATNASTWDAVKNTAVDAANWVVRQAKWVGRSCADFVIKLYEIARPFFVGIGRFFMNSYYAIKEFFMENKQLSIGILVTLGGAFVAATAFSFLFGDKCNQPEPTR